MSAQREWIDPLKVEWWDGITKPNGEEVWTFAVYPPGTVSPDYLVSSHGRIMRVAGGRGTRPGTLLKQPPTGGKKGGYPTVCLSRRGRCHTYNTHVLVLWTFRGQPPRDEFGEFQGHHVGHDRADNRLDNLEWKTARENAMEQWNRRGDHAY